MSENLNRAKAAVTNSRSFRDREVTFLRQAIQALIDHAEELEERQDGIESA